MPSWLIWRFVGQHDNWLKLNHYIVSPSHISFAFVFSNAVQLFWWAPLSGPDHPLPRSLEITLYFCVGEGAESCDMYAGTCRSQKRASDTLRLEFLNTWVLGTKLQASGRAGNALSSWAIFPLPFITFWNQCFIWQNIYQQTQISLIMFETLS